MSHLLITTRRRRSACSRPVRPHPRPTCWKSSDSLARTLDEPLPARRRPGRSRQALPRQAPAARPAAAGRPGLRPRGAGPPRARRRRGDDPHRHAGPRRRPRRRRVRRHVATVNAEWGVPASILLGDYLFTHAFHLAATTGSADACRLIGDATNRICEGRAVPGAGARQPGADRGRVSRPDRRQDGRPDRLLLPPGRPVQRCPAEVGRAAGALRPLAGPGVPDRRRPARPGGRGADDGQVAGHRPGTAEDDVAADPPAGSGQCGRRRADCGSSWRRRATTSARRCGPSSTTATPWPTPPGGRASSRRGPAANWSACRPRPAGTSWKH